MRKGLSFPKSLFFYSCTLVLGTLGMLFIEGNLDVFFIEPIKNFKSLFSFLAATHIICLPLWLVILPYFGVFGNWQKKYDNHTIIYFNAGFGLLLSSGWALLLDGFSEPGFFMPFILAACISGILTALIFCNQNRNRNRDRWYKLSSPE